MDSLTKERRSWNMSRIQGKNTNPERLVRSALHRLGRRFRLHVKGLPGTPDIVLPKHKVVIFVHGCFWHRHKGCRNCSTPSTNRSLWLGKFDGNVRRDAAQRRAIQRMGWRVVRVWECEAETPAKLQRILRRAGLISAATA